MASIEEVVLANLIKNGSCLSTTECLSYLHKQPDSPCKQIILQLIELFDFTGNVDQHGHRGSRVGNTRRSTREKTTRTVFQNHLGVAILKVRSGADGDKGDKGDNNE